MKKLLGSVIIFLGLAASAHAADRECIKAFGGRTSYPHVAFTFDTPVPALEYDFSLSREQLTSQSRGRMHVGRHERVNGLTQAEMTTSIRVGAATLEMPGGGACVWPHTVEATLGYDEMRVLVARDFPRDSCAFRVTMEHEHAHVNINIDALRKHAPVVRSRLESHIKMSYPKRVRYAPQALDKTVEDLSRVMGSSVEAMVKERDRNNAELDSPESYRYWQSLCRNW